MKPLLGLMFSVLLCFELIGGCTPIPVTVCTTVAYKNKARVASKRTDCHTTYYWHCGSSGSSSGGSSSGGSSSGGSQTGSGTTSGSGPSNSGEVVDCMKDVVNFSQVLYEFGDPQRPGHKGIDLGAANGTQLRSPVDGRVSSVTDGVPRDSNVGNNGSFAGNQIVIIVDGAYDSNGNAIPGTINRVILDHLDPGIQVSQNQIVRAGDLLGQTDNTGNTNIGPHLHMEFQVYKQTPNGPQIESVNPRDLIDRETCN